ncbi:MAG: hypothetical protein WA705_16385 [Candidatus Ozemobacteraceae bacterium]
MISDLPAILAWFESSRRKLMGRGIWLLGGEPGTMPPEVWNTANLRVLIVRLSSYQDTAAGITHSFLYQLAQSVPGVFVDLAFLPPERDERLMRTAGIPLLLGATSKHAAQEFDILAISNSVVQELINLPALLEGSGIPLSRAERGAKGSPFVVLGGSNSYATSVLHGPVGVREEGDGLVDAVIVGDGEAAFPRFLREFSASKNRNESLQNRITTLRKSVPGFYDPSAYREAYDEAYGEGGRLKAIEMVADAPFPVRAARARGDAFVETFTGGPVAYEEQQAGTSHLLISAGCPYFCSFCKESWEQKPYRERDPQTLIASALRLKAAMGLSELNLMTFNANTFSQLGTLLDALEPSFARVSIKSQRFDAIARSPRLLERQLDAGKRTYTCAMEGISERLRIFLQKNLNETTLIAGFKELFTRNIRQMKVFLIVTGREEETDLAEFGAFLSKLKVLTSNLKGKPILTFSLAGLFRPPHTPLQFEPPRRDLVIMERAFKAISETAERAGFESRISAGPWDAGLSEMLAWGDRRLTRILVESSLAKGFRYRGEVEPQVYRFWREKIRETGLENIFFAENRTDETVFPWDDIDVGISKKYLWETFKKLSAGKETISCLAKPLGTGVCGACGACIDTAERERVTKTAVESIFRIPKVSSKNFEKPKRYRIEVLVPERWDYVGNAFLFAALGRALMLGKPDWTAFYLRFSQGLSRFGASGYFIGEFEIKSGASSFDQDKDVLAVQHQLAVYGVSFLSLKPSSGEFESAIPSLTMRIYPASEEERPATVAHRVDGVLAKYRLKHQKRREGESLVWELHAGHAGKEGISRIRLLPDVCILELDLLHSVEPHLVGAFGGSGRRELCLLREQAKKPQEGKSGGESQRMGRRRSE